jgi:membrane-bound lytic murein transglycosylase MltF
VVRVSTCVSEKSRSEHGARMKHVVLLAIAASAVLCLPVNAEDLPASKKSLLNQAPALNPWTGDLDGMIKRRVIRALVAPSRTAYWVNGASQIGAEYELLKAFEKQINHRYAKKGKRIPIYLAIIPTRQDQLISDLVKGRGDLAAGILTVTPERLAHVDFGEPFFRGVKQIVVTGPASPELTSLKDLSGQQVYVRRSSSYWSHLEHLNEQFADEDTLPVRLKAAPEDLEDDDLLEMVNAGLIGIAVVNRYQALLWAKVFKNLTPREDLVVNKGGEIAWMIRKQSPKLKAEIARFAKTHGYHSTFGRLLVKKYVGSTKLVKPAAASSEIKKFKQTVGHFRKYGAKYDLDYLLMMAQGYQESRLDQNARSRAGAIGVMQLMPATGQAMGTGDIRQLEPNIHAGIKYVSRIRDHYFSHQPMDARNKTLFALAAYNAGPSRIHRLQREARKGGLDPHVWFNNVEMVAAQQIGEETVTYVSNIFKYYAAYKLIDELRAEERKARHEFLQPPPHP